MVYVKFLAQYLISSDLSSNALSLLIWISVQKHEKYSFLIAEAFQLDSALIKNIKTKNFNNPKIRHHPLMSGMGAFRNSTRPVGYWWVPMGTDHCISFSLRILESCVLALPSPPMVAPPQLLNSYPPVGVQEGRSQLLLHFRKFHKQPSKTLDFQRASRGNDISSSTTQ